MEGLMWFGVIATLAVAGIGLYLLPTAVAVLRRHHNPMPVIVINVLLGWTLLGWVGSLAMSFHTPPTGSRAGRPTGVTPDRGPQGWPVGPGDPASG